MVCSCLIVLVSKNNGSFHGTQHHNGISFPGTIYKNKEKNQRDLARGVVTYALNGRIWDNYQGMVSLFGCISVSSVFFLIEDTIL